MKIVLRSRTFILVHYQICTDENSPLIIHVLSSMQVLFSEARVMGLGPRFMSLYIHKLAVSSFYLD